MISKFQLNNNFKKLSVLALVRFFFQKKNRVRSIKDILNRQYFNNIGQIGFFKSGRSALFNSLVHLKKQGFEQIFLPDRLCNLLTLAAEKADLKIDYYKIDNLESLNTNTFTSAKKSIVLTASIWGKEFNNKKYIEFIRSQFTNEVAIILDECQNLNKDSSLNIECLGINDFIIFSFNDKTIPGFMGGVIWSPKVVFTPQKLSLKEELHFLLYFISDLMNYSKKSKSKKFKGEFSLCTGLRYSIDQKEMSRISIVFNSILLQKWSSIEEHRLNNFNIVSTRIGLSVNNNLTPYIPLENNNISQFPLKGPYLKYQNETVGEAINDGGHICIINSYKYKFF